MKNTVEAEVRGEHERAAVVGVVAHEEVGHRSLRRGGLQRGMRVDDAGRSEESRIRDSPDSGVAVVVRHILEQPVDGVVEIAAVVNILLRLLVVDVRTHFDELALRHVAAAHVLKNEDVSRLVEVGRGAELRAVQVDTVGADAIGRAVDQERVGVRTVFGDVDGCEQVNAVAHRDSVFIFRVVLFDVEVRRLGAGLSQQCRGGDQ